MAHTAGKGTMRWGHVYVIIVVSNNRAGLLGQFFVECCYAYSGTATRSIMPLSLEDPFQVQDKASHGAQIIAPESHKEGLCHHRLQVTHG